MTRPSPTLRRLDVLIAALLGMGAFGLYVNTVAPTLLTADAAEFQLACSTLGIAHPTGYPLYLILGWLWSHLLPLGDAAYRVNLLSAVFASSSIVLFYPFFLSLSAQALPAHSKRLLRGPAIIAAAMLAVSRTFWSQALGAEVYSLNSLFVVSMLFLLLLWSESRSPRVLMTAAAVYGLSLTHHVTMLLFLPAYLLFVWLTDRWVFRNLRQVVLLCLMVLLPLALYVYIPWRAPVTPYLHIELAPGRALELYDNSFRGFLGFLTGQMFVGEIGIQAPLPERMTMVAGFLLTQYGVAGVALGVLGLARLGLGGKAFPGQRLLALLGLSYVALVGFTLIYNVGDIHVFYTPSYIVFVVWIGVGMAWLLDAAGSFLSRLSLRAAGPATTALVVLLALLPAGLLVSNYPRADRSDDYQARAWAEDLLSQPLPPGAILISNDRNEITPLLYLQHVEGVRTDLLTTFPLMLPGEQYANVVRVIDGVLDVDRRLFLVKPMPGLEIKYQMREFGALVEVTGSAITGPPQHQTDLPLGDVLTLIGYAAEPDQPVGGSYLRVSLFWRADRKPDEDYHTYVHLLDEQGQVVAQSDHRPGREYYPSSLWQPGETLLDVHILSIPGQTQETVVTLVSGGYEYPSLAPLGSALTLGELRIDRQPRQVQRASSPGTP